MLPDPVVVRRDRLQGDLDARLAGHIDVGHARSYASGPGAADPWIKDHVEQVDDEVDDDDHDGDQRGQRLHYRVVAAEHRLHDERAEAVQREELLDDQRPAYQRADVDAEDGDEGEARGPQRVCRHKMRRSEIPFDFAIVMKSSDRVAAMSVRSSRT